MRRGLAGVILGLGLLAGSLAMSGWWFRSTMLQPERTERIANAVFDSPEVRAAVGRLIAKEVSDVTGQQTAEVDAFVQRRLTADDLSYLSSLVAKVHSAAVGSGPSQITLTTDMLTPLVGANVAQVVVDKTGGASITVPVVKPLRSAREHLTPWLRGLLAVCLGAIAAAFLLHPSRPAVFRRIGWWLLGLTAWQLLLTWVVPKFVVPAVTDNPWALLAGEVATVSAVEMRPALIALGVAGVGSLGAAWAWGTIERDRQRAVATVYAAGPPTVGSAGWSAWAASNAAASQRRHDRTEEVPRVDGPIRFGRGHDRESTGDTWGL
jgi:hypothetical protein